MAYGCAAAGGNAFLSSSSPGIALMQEGMSFMCAAEIPMVVLNVSRGGPGIGSIQPGQADYNQATRGGGNGDYHIPVFAPASIQETVDILYEATALANKYRNPIMVLVDGMMGQMMEPIVLPEERPFAPTSQIATEKPWAVSGSGGKEKRSVVRALILQPEELEAHVEELFKKYARAEKELVRYETQGLDDAEIVFVAYGTFARLAMETIDLLAAEGIKAGLIRPISLWPFPYEAFDHLSAQTKVVISGELSMGQMLNDVKLGVCGRFPVHLVNRTGGIIPTALDIKEKTMKIWEGIK